MVDSIAAPETGQIVFTERHQPPLQAGGYEITVTQALSNSAMPDGKNAAFIDEAHTATSRFAVRGERFSFDPNELQGVFPPRNNQGEYHTVLPHVVFERRTLPWERSPNLTSDGVSWLAILLFDAETAPKPQTAVAGDLQRTVFARRAGAGPSPSQLPATTASYADAFATIAAAGGSKETFELDYGEAWFDSCQIIDVPLDLFDSIAPSLADLAWLAHVRTVGAEKKAGGGHAQDNAILVGNRLPRPNATSVVHLVSLEGMGHFLPSASGARAQALTGGQFTTLRLITLASWSFTSIDPACTFTGYLEGASAGALQQPLMPGVQAPDAVVNAFRLGYTAMDHATRLGDQAVSWYRGPLIPFSATATIVPQPGAGGAPPIETADQATRFDPTTGMADITYAAAWQIGRSLALAASSFSIALYNWKRAASIKTVQAAQQQHVKTLFANLFPNATPSELASNTAQLLATALSASITQGSKP